MTDISNTIEEATENVIKELRSKLPPDVLAALDEVSAADFACGDHRDDIEHEDYETLYRRSLVADLALLTLLHQRISP